MEPTQILKRPAGQMAAPFVLALALGTTAISPTADADAGWFVGGGILSVSFEDDFDTVDSEPGIGFSGGYRFDNNLSAELIANLSIHEDALFEDDILQSSFMAGAKYSFGESKFRPYAVIGLSLNLLEIGDLEEIDDEDDFDDLDSLSGIGLYAGFGADIFVAKQHSVNVGYRTNRWDDKDDGTRFDIQTDFFSVTYNYYIGG